MRSLRASVIQCQAVADAAQSSTSALEACRSALARGARLVVLPENFSGVAAAGQPPLFVLHGELDAEPAMAPWKALSAGHPDATLILGGVPWQRPRAASSLDARPENTAIIVSAGRVAGTYGKLHRFDAELPDGQHLRESEHVRAGDELVLLRTPDVCVGLSICYDLRFPSLYGRLRSAGAEVLVVPSAFTIPTGRAHWEVLLRARAIETQCFVLAPAQVGRHAPGRASWGGSLIIDPWGEVLARASAGESGVAEILDAVLDGDRVREIRARMPVQAHARDLTETSVRVIALGEGSP